MEDEEIKRVIRVIKSAIWEDEDIKRFIRTIKSAVLGYAIYLVLHWLYKMLQ